nr:hypothetical protein [Xylella fastidiosa]
MSTVLYFQNSGMPALSPPPIPVSDNLACFPDRIKMAASLKENLKLKLYSTEKVSGVVKELAEAPALPLKFISHSETIAKLSKHIKDMHYIKNYDARDIAKMISEKGIKIKLKEIKCILQTKEKN